MLATHYTTTETGKTAYYTHASFDAVRGDILVLLHGFCENSTIWQLLLPYLPPNSQVVCIDIGSFGGSKLQRDTTVENMAVQVADVLTALQIARCVLLGHSLGGYVTLAFAAQFPQYLAGFGLLHSHPFVDTFEKKENRRKTIQFIQRHGVAPFAKQFFYALFAPDFARANTHLIEELTATARTLAPETIIAASYAMIDRTDRSAVLQTTALPVLIVGGKQDDTIHTPVSIAQSLLPNTSKLVLLARVGHMSMYEAPQALANAITHYLSTIH